VLALVSIEWPLRRDLMLIGEQTPGATVDCVEAPGGRIAPLDCRITRRFYYVEHRVNNCLGTKPPTAVDDRLYYDPYHYYYHLWSARTAVDRDVLVPPHLTLCGERWQQIFERTRLQLYCNPDVALQVALKPWYEAALQAMTAFLNQRFGEPALWLALATLERTCGQRDATGQYGLRDSVFYNMTEALRDSADVVVNGATQVCEWMVQEEPELLGDVNITLPFYVTHYRAWYFALFKYVVPPDADMPRAAVTLLLIPLVVLGVTLVSIAFTVYHVFFRPSERTLNAYSVIN
jgi:hypothetical protein